MRSLLPLVFTLAAVAVLAAEENVAVSNNWETAKRDFQQGKFDSALAALNEAEKRGEPSAKGFDLKGRIYVEQQKYDDALAAFEAAYNLEKTSLARLHLADMFMRQKRFEEARAMYEAASKETNILITNERLRYGLLIASLAAKNEEAARVAFENVPFPTESAAYYYAQSAWAFAHGSKGDGEKWIKRAEEIFAVKNTAWFAQPQFELGWIKAKPPLIAD